MPFEGDLKVVSLESVLRNIAGNNLSGVLSIRDDRGERKMAFMGGKIYAILPLKGEELRVPDALQKKNLIAAEEAEKVRTSLAWKRLNLKRALEYRGLVKEQDYAQAVRDEVIVPQVVEMLQHPDRSFRFEETPLEHTPVSRDAWDPDQLAADLRVPVESVMLECVKRLDAKKTRRVVVSPEALLADSSDGLSALPAPTP